MSIIASSSDNLKFHQWPEGVLHQSYKPSHCDEGPIKSISWGRDGSWMVLVPSSGPAEVISIKDNVKVLQTLQHICHPTCATFQNTTKKNMTIGAITGQVLVYDIKARNVKKRFPRAPSTILNLEYNSKDTHIAAACASGDILLYSNTSVNISSSYKVPQSDSVSAINFHRTKRNLFSAGSETGIIAIWDINTNKILCEKQAHQAPVTDMKFSPIRSDLFVTSGLDQRIAFYDLVSKKSVMEVEITNPVTAIDFSYCGTYLALGSQNGNIVLYDVRNLNKPISAFSAHDGKKIRNLYFQKVPLTNIESDSDNFTLMTDNVPSAKSDSELDISNKNDDSLKFEYFNNSNSQVKSGIDGQGDSFLEAIGFQNKGNCSDISIKSESCTALGITEEVKKWMDSNKRLSLQQNNANQTSLQKSIQFPTTKQSSSTPKATSENFTVTTVSPIIQSNPTLGTDEFQPSMEDLKTIIKDVVREEFKKQMTEYKKDMEMEFVEMQRNVQRHVLELQMLIVKQFVDLETNIDKLNNVTAREFVCDEFLISQNNRLLKEVEILRKQLAERDVSNYSRRF